MDDYVNVDRFGEPDVRHDLEVVPWPWPDDSVGEVVMNHVLEHLGRDTDTYLGVMKELYRVCRDGATIQIIVPHHRHDYFSNDPTHVRAVTAEGMALFSHRLNRRWAAQGIANSPLGLYLGIDFEIVDVQEIPSDFWRRLQALHPLGADLIMQQKELYNNVIEEVRMLLRVVKPAGREVEQDS
jgi:hypothetical protein